MTVLEIQEQVIEFETLVGSFTLTGNIKLRCTPTLGRPVSTRQALNKPYVHTTLLYNTSFYTLNISPMYSPNIKKYMNTKTGNDNISVICE